MSSLNAKLSDLDESELKELFTSTETETILVSTQIEAPSNEKGLEEAESAAYWLHASIKRTCYVVYSKYRYEAFTSKDKKGKKKVKVDEIKLEMNSGNGKFLKSKKDTSQVKKLDEVYGSDNTCKRAKLLATATINGQSWSAEVKQ